MLILLKRGRRGRGAQVRACLPACAPWTLARASGVVAKPSVARFRFRCEALENAIESLFSPRATRRGPRRPITAEFATLCRRFRPRDPWGRRTRPKLHPTRSPRSKKTRASRSPSSASGRADAVISERLVRRARPRPAEHLMARRDRQRLRRVTDFSLSRATWRGVPRVPQLSRAPPRAGPSFRETLSRAG